MWVGSRLAPSAFNIVLARTLTNEAFANYQQQLYIALLISPLIYIGATDRILQDVQVSSLRRINYYLTPICLLGGTFIVLGSLCYILIGSSNYGSIIELIIITLVTALAACIIEMTRAYAIIPRSYKAIACQFSSIVMGWFCTDSCSII